MQLFMRLFAVCVAPAAAESIRLRLLETLSAWQPTAHATPTRYWKIPEYWEFTFHLAPPVADTLRAVQSCSPAGWAETDSDGEISCVWNKPPGGRFLVPEAIWAELSLHR